MKARERKEEEAGLSPGFLMFGGLGPKEAGFMNPNSNPNPAPTPNPNPNPKALALALALTRYVLCPSL